MSRESLVDQLESLTPASPPGCFVLVGTYLIPARLSEAEENLDAQGVYSSRLRNQVSSESAAPTHEVIAVLRGLLSRPAAFDRLLLEWLIRLDGALARLTLDRLTFRGFDGKLHRVRRTCNLIADYLDDRLPEVTWAPHQSVSIAAFARRHAVVPCEHPSGYEVACRSARTWAGRRLASRLLRVKRTCGLRVMLWPFQVPPLYTGLDLRKLPSYFRLESLDNDEDVAVDVREALDAAFREEVTILVFPELAISPAVETTILETLRDHGPRGYPLLTLYGRCHRRSHKKGHDLNEAVLLGPDGRELASYRKLAPYQDRQVVKTEAGHEEVRETKERLVRGKAISIYESPVGNLVPLICLDFFQAVVSDVVNGTHGNVFLVPSLSSKTTTHRDRATRLQARLKASSFVCNRWLDHCWNEERTADEEPEENGTSFFRIPGKGGYVTHLGDRPETPFLLFSLTEERDRLLR